jgi:hypothetical protein
MRSGGKKQKIGAQGEEIYRYWVELRDVQSGSICKLSLRSVVRVRIPRKKNEPPTPREEILQLQDDAGPIEAKSLDQLATQLRERYPDECYVRTLHRERDREAEERRRGALNGLVDHIVECFIRTLSSEDAGLLGRSLDTEEGQKALREIWPTIVDAYFQALCNPRPRAARSS